MGRVQLVVVGPGAGVAADRLERLLRDEGAPALDRQPVDAVDATLAIDPVAVAALVLSIPSAVLAVLDLAERFRKRRRAREVLDAAAALRAEGEAGTYLVAVDGVQPLEDLSPDELLAAFDAAEAAGDAP